MPAKFPARIRPDARELADFLGGAGVSLNQFTPGPDGWHSAASIRAGLAATAQARQRAPRPIPAAAARTAAMASTAGTAGSQDQGDVVAWALRTNRISATSVSAWSQRLAADPSVAGTLRALTPVNLGGTSAANRTVSRAAGPYASTTGLPAFTASGVDPKAIAGYAPVVRTVLASIPDRDMAFRLAQRYGAMSQDDAVKAMWSDPQIPVDILHTATPADYVEPPKYPAPSIGYVTEGPLSGNSAAIQRQALAAHDARQRAQNPEHAAFWDALNARDAKANPKPTDDYWF